MPGQPIFDEKFITPFVTGLSVTLKDFCELETKMEKFGPVGTTGAPKIAIAGVIGVTGKKFSGAFTLGFPRETFVRVMNKILKSNHIDITSEIEDGAGELSNVVFGLAKHMLNEKGYEVKLALPTVLRSDDLSAMSQGLGAATEVLLSTQLGPIVIELAGNVIAPAAVDPALQTKFEVPKLDTDVLVSFVRAIRTTFDTQCRTIPEAGTPFAKSNKADSKGYDIGGIVSVTAASFTGTFAIFFEEDVFLQLVEHMTGERPQKITAEIQDAAAELVNISFGVAKRILNAEGHMLQTSIPTVVRGSKIQSSYPSSRPPVVVPFSILGGQMWTEFAFDPPIDI
ncbi:MAG: chemotaxis protein CheX [Bdellovibrionales bacterium]|nr:chemotaxis protein CheX [Bdellovibrionales bacterium]